MTTVPEVSDIVATNEPRCPFGYTGASPLTKFTCALCNSLLFESTVCNPCKDVFCKNCITGVKECPLCGQDVRGLEPAPKVQDLVNTYVLAHARNHELGGEGFQPTQSDDYKTEGMFYFHLAVRAMTGGNLESAESRCCLAQSSITKHHDSQATAASATLLAVILGKLGDIRFALGRHEDAANVYAQSAAILEPYISDLEAEHAYTVSLNKQGDMLWFIQSPASAIAYYLKSLDLRRARYQHEQSVAGGLSMLTVLAKVVDAYRNSEDSEHWPSLAAEGQTVVANLRGRASEEESQKVAQFSILFDQLSIPSGDSV